MKRGGGESREDKSNVTLIGEEHRCGSHMDGVFNLIKDKLKESNVVILALEQTTKTKIIKENNFRDGTEEKKEKIIVEAERSSNRGKKEDPINKKINNFLNAIGEPKGYEALSFEGNCEAKYFETFKKIVGLTKDNDKQVIIIGVDTAGNKYNKDKKNPARDRAMYNAIKGAIAQYGASEVIYPVGSAHINNFENDQIDNIKGDRLGVLLKQDLTINVELKNYYNKSGDESEKLGWQDVQNTINEFNLHHKTEIGVIPIDKKQEYKEKREPTLKKEIIVRKKKKEARSPSDESDKSHKKGDVHSRSRERGNKQINRFRERSSISSPKIKLDNLPRDKMQNRKEKGGKD